MRSRVCRLLGMRRRRRQNECSGLMRQEFLKQTRLEGTGRSLDTGVLDGGEVWYWVMR